MHDVVVWSVGSDNSRQLPLLRDAVTLLRISGELGGGCSGPCSLFLHSIYDQGVPHIPTASDRNHQPSRLRLAINH